MRSTALTHLSGAAGPTGTDTTAGNAVRARSTRDVLAAMPHLLGYRPRESVVVACVTAGSVLGFVARVDLDVLVAGGDGEVQAAWRVGRAARASGTTLAVVAVHSAASRATWHAGAERFRAALDDALGGTCDLESWWVGPGGYGGLECADLGCCPPQGRPLSDLEDSPVNAGLVLAGSVVADTRAAAFTIPTAPEPVRARAARAALRAHRAAAVGSSAASTAGADREDVERADAQLARRRCVVGYDLWRDLVEHAARELRLERLGAVDLAPARLGRFAAALCDVRVRDAVLLSLVPGAVPIADLTAGRRPARSQGAAADTGDDAADVEVGTARAIAKIVDPRVAVRPDPSTVEAATVVLERTVAATPRRWHAPPLALLGLLAWWQGDGGLAGHRVRAALEADPRHRLAALMAGVLDAAVPPGWVRSSDVRSSDVRSTDGHVRSDDGPVACPPWRSSSES